MTSLADRRDDIDEEAAAAARSMQSKWNGGCDGDRQQEMLRLGICQVFVVFSVG